MNQTPADPGSDSTPGSHSDPPQTPESAVPATTATDGIDAEVQREIEEALGGGSVEDLMNTSPPSTANAPASTAGEGEARGKDAPPQEFHIEMRRGRIAAIRGEDVFVEITGEAKLQGVVPLQQFERNPRVGSIMDFVVDHVNDEEGLMYLSREGAVSRATWDQLQRGAVVDARVTGKNKGGLELELVGRIRGFMPASQVDIHHIDDLEQFVGQKIEGSVQEIDRKAKKVLLSRRHLLEIRRRAAIDKIWSSVSVGDVVEGVVSNLAEFGAFVDLGGVDGLIHVSDLSYTHVTKPADVVKPGQKVSVKVLKLDREKERIGLGLKQVEPDPWETVEATFKPGDPVEGKVVRTTNFGAFVELQPGIEGLLPISELSWSRVNRVEDVVKEGDTIRLSVLTVEPKKHRLSLSLKQATGDPWIGAERKYERGSLATGTIKTTTDFGAFVELEAGVEGMVHISELADHRVGTVQDVLNVGDRKEFRVIEVDEDQRKIKLSLKQVASPAQVAPTQAGVKPRSGKAAPRKPRGDLKSGLGNVLGQGLGGLKLEDFNK